jgi:hypothetical protein
MPPTHGDRRRFVGQLDGLESLKGRQEQESGDPERIIRHHG